MLLYCPKCNNLVDKVSDKFSEGETLRRICNKCSSEISFYIKYQAVSSLIVTRYKEIQRRKI